MGRTTENMGHRNRKKSAETMGKQTARAGQTGGQEETNRDLPLISSHRQNFPLQTLGSLIFRFAIKMLVKRVFFGIIFFKDFLQ